MTTFKRAPVLVVDDDNSSRAMLQQILSRDEYDVVSAASAEDALRKLSVLSFEVVITDLRLPGLDGVHLLREIQRRWPDTTTIILTAYPTLDTSVAALRAGAYDYLSKPCPPSEIRHSVQEGLAKRRGLLRRVELMHALEQQLVEGLRALRGEPQASLVSAVELQAVGQAPPRTSARIVRAGSIIIDRERHEVLLGDIPLDLTPTEFDILAYMAERAPSVLSPQEIARVVFSYEVSDVEARELVRWHIHHLRHKLEVDPDQPNLLKNVRGIGYKLDISA